MKDIQKLVSFILIATGVTLVINFNPETSVLQQDNSSLTEYKDEGNYVTLAYPSEIKFRNYLENTPLFREVFNSRKQQVALDNESVLQFDARSDEDDYAEDLMKEIKKGEGPDLYVLKEEDLPSFRNSSCALDLKEGLSFTEKDFSYQYPSVLDYGRGEGKEIFASCYSVSSGMIAYRRDIAEKVLKVSSPKEVQQKIQSIEAINRLAPELKKNGYYLLSSFDEDLRYFYSQNTSPLYNENRMTFGGDNTLISSKEEDNALNNYVPSTWLGEEKFLCSKGYSLRHSRSDKEDYNADMKAGSRVFMFFLTSEEYKGLVNRAGNALKGKWGLIPSPLPYHRNSYYLLVNPNSRNLKTARYLIRGLTLDQEALRKSVLKNKTLVNSEYALDQARISSSSYSKEDITTSMTYELVFKQDALKLFSMNVKEDKLNRSRRSKDKAILQSLKDNFYYYLNYKEENPEYLDFKTSLNYFKQSLKELKISV